MIYFNSKFLLFNEDVTKILFHKLTAILSIVGILLKYIYCLVLFERFDVQSTSTPLPNTNTVLFDIVPPLIRDPMHSVDYIFLSKVVVNLVTRMRGGNDVLKNFSFFRRV